MAFKVCFVFVLEVEGLGEAMSTKHNTSLKTYGGRNACPPVLLHAFIICVALSLQGTVL